jgi:hypothetical protein
LPALARQVYGGMKTLPSKKGIILISRTVASLLPFLMCGGLFKLTADADTGDNLHFCLACQQARMEWRTWICFQFTTMSRWLVGRRSLAFFQFATMSLCPDQRVHSLVGVLWR